MKHDGKNLHRVYVKKIKSNDIVDYNKNKQGMDILTFEDGLKIKVNYNDNELIIRKKKGEWFKLFMNDTLKQNIKRKIEQFICMVVCKFNRFRMDNPYMYGYI